MKSLRLAKIIIFALTFVVNLSAQEGDTNTFMTRASQYYLGDRDEILIKVNIWGYVRKPGQYLIPRHTDLIALISFAGGPTDGANLSQVRIIRENIDEQGTDGQNGDEDKAPIITVNVKHYLETGERGLIPALKAGDTVMIPQSFGNKLRNTLGFGSVFGIIVAGGSLALIIERLSR